MTRSAPPSLAQNKRASFHPDSRRGNRPLMATTAATTNGRSRGSGAKAAAFTTSPTPSPRSAPPQPCHGNAAWQLRAPRVRHQSPWTRQERLAGDRELSGGVSPQEASEASPAERRRTRMPAMAPAGLQGAAGWHQPPETRTGH